MTEEEKAEIAARREKLAAMKGARDAMDAALKHIAMLETVLDRTVSISKELARMCGSDCMIKTYYGPGSGKELMSADDLLNEIKKWRAKL